MDADLRRAAADQGAERAGRLVADEEDGRVRSPEIVLEMMLHPSRIAHAGARQDDRTAMDAADRLALLDGLAQPEIAAGEGMAVLRRGSARRDGGERPPSSGQPAAN